MNLDAVPYGWYIHRIAYQPIPNAYEPCGWHVWLQRLGGGHLTRVHNPFDLEACFLNACAVAEAHERAIQALQEEASSLSDLDLSDLTIDL